MKTTTLHDPAIARLVSTLLSTNSLEETVDGGAAALGNPIAVFDSSYRVMAWSSRRSAPDDVWQEGIRRGYWNYEFVAKLNRSLSSTAENKRKTGDNPVVFTDLSQRRRWVFSLVIDGTLLGYLVILEAETKLESIDAEACKAVRQVLAKAVAMERAVQFHNRASSNEAILMDMLSGRFESRPLLRERIRGTEFDAPTQFCLYSVGLTGYQPENLRDETLKKALQAIFPLCWSVMEEDRIIVLAAHNIPHAEEAGRNLRKLLLKQGLSAGRSQIFNDLFPLPRYRAQSLRALELASELSASPFKNDGPVHHYDDYRLPDLLSRLSAGEIDTYCNSAVTEIAAYDQAGNTEYVKTLFHYLNTGKSIHNAAKALFVHHNTVHYRLSKVKQLFGIDFANECRNLQYYLSCIMLLYFNGNRQNLDRRGTDDKARTRGQPENARPGKA